jgi:hypothetical protein
MKKLLFIFLLLPGMLFSQARLVFNNNGYINIENNAYLVIDNGAANAVTLLGTGGNILSESETDLVKWNVGNATGNHIVPFTNTNGVKVPVEINITAAGSAGGSLLLSTYRTTNMNTPWPAVAPAVTNMCSPVIQADASLYVVDRFWRIDGNSYATKPGATLSFGYDFANEAGGANTINEANLQAQRFNPTQGSGVPTCPFPAPPPGPGGHWEGLLFGTVNTTTDRVNNAVISSADFFKDWILVDNSTPLPVTLLNFEVDCENGFTVLNWSTASEINNDYFVIEKSTDAINFFPIATVQGNGNSNTVLSYTYTDETPNYATTYYRLKQVDFDGKFEYFNVVVSTCTTDENFNVNQLQLNDNVFGFTINTSSSEKLTVYLYDYRGRIISQETIVVNKGNNPISLSKPHLSDGIYMLNIVGEKNHFSTKVLKQ